MDDRSSWKGQSFMLLVFAGIVFLCSIFFVLGMLVGRSQARKIAASASTDVAAKAALPLPQIEERTALPFNDRVETKRRASAAGGAGAAGAVGAAVGIDEPAASIGKSAAVEAPKPSSETKSSPPKLIPPPKTEKTEKSDVMPKSDGVKPILWQVDAYSTQSVAEALVRDLSKKGFPAFIVAPGESDKLYHVQVGPYTDPARAETARADLEKAVRHKVIRK